MIGLTAIAFVQATDVPDRYCEADPPFGQVELRNTSYSGSEWIEIGIAFYPPMGETPAGPTLWGEVDYHPAARNGDGVSERRRVSYTKALSSQQAGEVAGLFEAWQAKTVSTDETTSCAHCVTITVAACEDGSVVERTVTYASDTFDASVELFEGTAAILQNTFPDRTEGVAEVRGRALDRAARQKAVRADRLKELGASQRAE